MTEYFVPTTAVLREQWKKLPAERVGGVLTIIGERVDLHCATLGYRAGYSDRENRLIVDRGQFTSKFLATFTTRLDSSGLDLDCLAREFVAWASKAATSYDWGKYRCEGDLLWLDPVRHDYGEKRRDSPCTVTEIILD